MTADEQRREDLKRGAQILMTLLGGALLVGSLVGAVYGSAREAVGYWTAGEVEAE